MRLQVELVNGDARKLRIASDTIRRLRLDVKRQATTLY